MNENATRCFIAARRRRIGLAVLMLLAAAGAVDGADHLYQDRGDRFEGIQRAQNVSGGYFDLLGVQVRPRSLDREAEELQLSVPLRAEAELAIRVWEPETSYWMVPKRKTFGPGAVFSWPRTEVLGPRGIDLGKLYVLATNPTETLYYPARLFTGEAPVVVESYVFVFKSRGGVELEGMIAREQEGRLVPVRPIHREEDFGGILPFTWDGRSAAGESMPPGIYHLKLDGTVFLKKDERIRIDVPFVHHGESGS